MGKKNQLGIPGAPAKSSSEDDAKKAAEEASLKAAEEEAKKAAEEAEASEKAASDDDAKRRKEAREERNALGGYDVDEWSKTVFESMGITLTAAIAKSYCEYKVLKDRIQPGRLKPAEFVTIVMTAEKGE